MKKVKHRKTDSFSGCCNALVKYKDIEDKEKGTFTSSPYCTKCRKFPTMTDEDIVRLSLLFRTSTNTNNVLSHATLCDLKKKFQSWSGFEMTATNLVDAQKEIHDMKDTLSNEISDYANRLDALAKESFIDNL